MGKYSNIVNSKNESGKPENQKKIKPDSNKDVKPDSQKIDDEVMVNLSIKVPKRLRQKWVAESRLRGTTLTAIISDYLRVELGE